MNWARIKSRWKQFRDGGKRAQPAHRMQEAHDNTREASEKQLAEWLARQHEIDPIHK